MEPFDLPFGGLFDFNRDGVMDAAEEFMAYTLINGENMDEEEDKAEDMDLFADMDDDDGDD